MRVMILAAGRGERMGPLTSHTPKPLLDIGGKPLIAHQIERLHNAGFVDFVINVAYFGDQISNYLGDGSRLGVKITFSHEQNGPLETGGGIHHALPLLGPAPFVVVNSDIWTDYPFAKLPAEPDGLAHLVLVPNPEHNPSGDFGLINGRAVLGTSPECTFAGIAVYRPAMFAECCAGRFPTAPLLRHAAVRGLVSAELFDGVWIDAGTPDRLAQVRAMVVVSPEHHR